MAISLKRYDRQVGVSAETGTQPISGGLASAMIQEAGLADQVAAQTFQMLGETGAEIYKDFQERNDEAELARINREFLVDSTAFQEQLELINNEEEIAELSNYFKKTQQDKINNFKLSPETKRQALISFDNNLAKQDVLVGSRILKLGLEKQDRNFLDIENDSINGVLREGFNSLEEQYDYANKQRVEIGSKTYDSYLSDKRSFAQKKYFKEMRSLLETNIDSFNEVYDSTKLNVIQQQEILDLRKQANQEIISETLQIQTETMNKLTSLSAENLLTVDQIDSAFKTTTNIYGKEVPTITETQKEMLLSLVTSAETIDKDLPLFNNVIGRINNLNKSPFDSEKISNILKDLYKKDATGKYTPYFSLETTKDILDALESTIIGDGKSRSGGSKLTSSQKETFQSIVDYFEFNMKTAEKKKEIGKNINTQIALINSFNKNVVKGGQDSREWEKQNLIGLQRKSLMEAALQVDVSQNKITTDPRAFTNYNSWNDVPDDIMPGTIIMVNGVQFRK